MFLSLIQAFIQAIMKFTLIAVIALFAFVNCAPSETENVIPFTDEDGLKDIDAVFDFIYKRINERPMNPEAISIKLIMDNVDRNCILNQAKKYNIEHKIAEFKEGVIDRNPSDESIIGQGIVIGYYCVNKIDTFLEFVFENFMTFHTLYQAFADEAALAPYVDKLRCANAYAVNHKIVDSESYSFDTVVKNAEECETDKEVARKIIDDRLESVLEVKMIKNNKECFQKLFASVENFFLRYILLVQVEMTKDQIVNEKANFIKGFHSHFDGFLQCALSTANEIHA
jgi:hypothetical protein